MQKKMRFQINEIGEIETLFGFSDPFPVTGGGLLSHSSDTGDNETTALWTEAGGINKSKLISPAPKRKTIFFRGCPSFREHGASPSEEAFTEPFGRDGCPERRGKKGPTWCQNREQDADSTFTSSPPQMCFVAQAAGEIMRVRCRFLLHHRAFSCVPHRRRRRVTTALHQQASVKQKLHLARRKHG